MIDPYLLRNEIDETAEKLRRRGFKLDIEKFRDLEKQRKTLQIKTEKLQAERNFWSKRIGEAKARGENIHTLCLELNKLIKKLNEEKTKLKLLKSEILNIILLIPNLPDNSVPLGTNKNANIELKRWGVPREFNFKIRDHVTLGKMHNGLDFVSAAKLAGSRFVVMHNQIAHLHRALIQFMLDLHTVHHGYCETYVPYLVNRKTLYSAGQLPKFEDLT